METTGNKKRKIVERLLEQIRSGAFPEGKRIPSEYDLAEQFQVHKMTANAAVEELVVRGYLERRERGGGTVVRPHAARFKGTIAVFMGGVAVSYYSSLLCGIQEGAQSYGYNTLLYHSLVNNDPDETVQFLRMGGVSGALIANFFHVPELEIPVLWIDKNRIPIVRGEFNHLMHDDYRGGAMLADHLYDLGHRRIVYVTQYSNILSRRFDGFRETLAKHGVELLTKEAYFRSGLSPLEFLRRLLKRFPEATAIACDGDNVAFEFYWSLRELGLRVPEDLSLTGFSGFPEVQRLIKLTTVDEHPHRIGFCAAELLAGLIEKRLSEPLHEVFDVEFLNGATTAPPRSSAH